MGAQGGVLPDPRLILSCIKHTCCSAVIFNPSKRVPSVILKDRDGVAVLWMLYCVIGSMDKVQHRTENP